MIVMLYRLVKQGLLDAKEKACFGLVKQPGKDIPVRHLEAFIVYVSTPIAGCHIQLPSFDHIESSCAVCAGKKVVVFIAVGCRGLTDACVFASARGVGDKIWFNRLLYELHIEPHLVHEAVQGAVLYF